ncbi:Uncharacterised protein [Streptococcus pyogenes]|nr:hypothetical protein Z339_00457 [Streptococcus pyogenes ABC020030925]SQF22970.1 Uncharacterised protein [Streptococcus pyogenes]SUO61245.1 Uncharacterised protein [Streptococcus pyogenes]VGR29680.1 Uncharacterised protein [Streptococcus pyogenes]VGR54729.1 Uncharacterised protein [Streptococcus pyogenes]
MRPKRYPYSGEKKQPDKQIAELQYKVMNNSSNLAKLTTILYSKVK